MHLISGFDAFGNHFYQTGEVFLIYSYFLFIFAFRICKNDINFRLWIGVYNQTYFAAFAKSILVFWDILSQTFVIYLWISYSNMWNKATFL